MLLAVAIVFGATHYHVLLHGNVGQPASSDAAATAGLKFPTVEQMCRAAGVTGADTVGCINDETSAAEFVGAWLDLNGFLTNGRIDVEQIQLSAELAAAD